MERNKWYCDQCGASFIEYPCRANALSHGLDTCPTCGQFTEFTYIDILGGRHSTGLGWSPEGDYCGECSRMSCEKCRTWRENLVLENFSKWLKEDIKDLAEDYPIFTKDLCELEEMCDKMYFEAESLYDQVCSIEKRANIIMRYIKKARCEE